MKKNNMSLILNLLTGALIFCYIIWLRFILERLPKDIPFIFSLKILTIIILIFIAYGYQLKKIMRYKNPKNIFRPKSPHYLLIHLYNFIGIFYKPISVFQNIFITNKYLYPVICNIVKSFIKLYIKFKLYNSKHYLDDYFYILYAIIPRFIITIFFILDIFCFHQLNLFYKILPIGLIPMIFSFLLNCVKIILNNEIQYLNNNFIIKVDENDQTENSNYYWDIKDLLTHPDYNTWDGFAPLHPNLHTLEVSYFVDMQACAMWGDHELYKYKGFETWDARQRLEKKLNIKDPVYKISDATDDIITVTLRKEFYDRIPHTIHLQVYINCNEQKGLYLNRKVRNALTVVLMLTLIGWSYILFTGNYENVLPEVMIYLQSYKNNIEPFSNTNL